MPAFTPMLSRGDFDPMQIAIVVLFLIGSFVKWLWENWQAKRDLPPPSPEEDSLREDAQRRRAGPPPLTPAAPSPLDEWRRAWKEIQEAAKPAARPAAPPPPARRGATPPPLRQASRQKVQAAAPQAAPAPAAVVAPAVAQPQASVPQVSRASSSALLGSLHQLRRDPALLRQAIVMHEILGPPKALQQEAPAL